MSAPYPRARAAGASAVSGAGAAGAPRAVGDPAGEKGAAAGRASVASASLSSSAAAASLRAAPAPARPAVARADLLLGALFLALALATRLWRIEDPRAIVFDESHFTKFSTWYLSGHYYVDIHPPLAKLVYAGVLRALGFTGAGELRVKWWTADGFVGTRDWMLLYEEEYRTASGLLPYLPLRWAAAFAGCALVVAMFATARALGLGRAPAAVATTLVLCETVTALQSRLILCDAWLYLFNVASFGASFASVRPGLSDGASLGWALGTGLLLGCALSVKLTAIGTVGTVAVHQAIVLGLAWRGAGERGERGDRGERGAAARWRVLAWGVARAAIMLAALSAVFFALWTVHIALLPYSGQGDGFASPAYAATLFEKPAPNATPPAVADPLACPNPLNTWSDCGFSPMTEAQCLERGCCWDPTSNKAWCYHVGTLTRPTLGFFAKMADVLRATNAINHGAVLNDHPFMSGWREWPLLGGKSVPFGSSTEGAPITALGNPGVHWPVAAAVLVASLGLAALGVLHASRGLAERAALVVGDEVAADEKEHSPRGSTAGAVAPDAGSDAWPEDGGGARGTPLWVAALTLTVGYYANLVPYELIERSKFIYHYNPALLIGVLLLATLLDAGWAAAERARARAGARATVAALAVAVAGVAIAGFVYWGVPYVYGVRVSPEGALARRWRSGWVT